MASQHLWTFFSPQEPPPAFVTLEEDVDKAAKERILLLAKYAMQNGTSFIEMVKNKQAGNPEYDFLTPGGKSNTFFRWAMYATGCNLPVEQPLPEGFVPPVPQTLPQQQQQQPQQPVPQQYAYAQQQPYGYPGQPPAMPHYAQYPVQQQQYQQPVQQQQQRPTPPPIPPEVAGGFSQVLDALTGSKDSIKASQGWFMACAPHAAGMAYMMAYRASTTTEFDKLLHLIYLANDILFKAFTQQQQQQQQADGQQQQQQQQMDASKTWASMMAAFSPALGVVLAAAQAAANSSGNEAGREKLNKMLTFWQEKGLFDATTMARFHHEMAAVNPTASLLYNYPPPAAAAAPPEQQQQPAPASGGWGPPPAAAAAPGFSPQQPPASGWGPPPAAAAAAAAAGAPSPASGWGPPPVQAVQQQPPGWPPAATAPPVPPAGVPWPGIPPQYPGAVPPAYPGAVPPAAAVPPGAPPQYPGTVPPQYAGYPHHGVVPPGAVPPGVPPPGVPFGAPPAAAAPVEPAKPPEPEPVSSFTFPPGLIPQLAREKSKWSEAYAPIDPIEIDKAGLPPPPEKDAYLKSRIEKFLLEVRDYKAGTSRADLEESRAAARAQQGLEPDSDEELALGSTGSRITRRKALGLGAGGAEGRRRHRVVSGGMADDGSYVGPGGGRGERLGLGAHGAGQDAAAALGDVYGSYRKLRSTSYHEMIVRGVGQSNMAKGGT